MSIIVKHRTDIDLVAERVGVQLGDRRASEKPSASVSLALRGLAPRIVEFCEELRARGRERSAPRSCSTRSPRSRPFPGPSPPTSARRWRRRSPSRRRTAASSSWSSTASSSGPPRRGALELDVRESRPAPRAATARPRSAPRGDPRGDRRAATTARCATSRGSRSPPSAARARARASSAWTSSGSGATLGLQVRDRDAAEDGRGRLDRDAGPALRAPPAPRARARA